MRIAKTNSQANSGTSSGISAATPAAPRQVIRSLGSSIRREPSGYIYHAATLAAALLLLLSAV
jgi:hypothetical protein